MQILVDADACPRPIKAIIIKAALRCNISAMFVANAKLELPTHALLRFVQVDQCFDAADDQIIACCSAGDVVITADIPLADALVAQSAIVITPRGHCLNRENIKQQLSIRNFMQVCRGSGVTGTGPKPLHKRDIQAFANALDRKLNCCR